MSLKALRKGDPLPPVNNELMRIYSMRFCPYAQRTRLVLNDKGIPYEIVNIYIADVPDWFIEKTPLGRVPVLEHNRHVVYESRVCNDFLDRTYPDVGGGRLASDCPIQRSRDEMLMCYFDDKVIPYFYQFINTETREGARDSLRAGLDVMENKLGDKQFFGGDRPCMVDYHVYPWFERFPAIRQMGETTGEDSDPMPEETGPCLTAWVRRLQSLPQVRATMVIDQHHKEFYSIYSRTLPGGYDIGLNLV